MQNWGDATAADAQTLLRDMEEALSARDRADASRDSAPMCVADDAHVIETDTLDAQAVLAEALRFARERLVASRA